MSGWIKIHRSITNHWLYTEKRVFSKFEAWNDMLMNVNYADSKISIKGKLYEVKRGQSLLSLDTWSKRWNWDKSKVRRFLKLLESDNMIVLKSDNITTQITICKYDTYQDSYNADETQMKHKRNADEIQTTPLKEEEEKEKNKTNKEKELTPKNKFSDEVIKLYEYFLNHFEDQYKPKNEKQKNNWLDCIDKLIRIDKLSGKEINEIILNAKNDNFWSSNFLTILKLRESNREGIKYHVIFKNLKKNQKANETRTDEQRNAVENFKQRLISSINK